MSDWRWVSFRLTTTSKEVYIFTSTYCPPPSKGLVWNCKLWELHSWHPQLCGGDALQGLPVWRKSTELGSRLPKPGAYRTSQGPTWGWSLHPDGTPAGHLDTGSPRPPAATCTQPAVSVVTDTQCLRYACHLEGWSHSKSGVLDLFLPCLVSYKLKHPRKQVYFLFHKE